MSRNYDNFADLITFSRASRGTSVRHVRYGDELVTNGTFDTDVSGWGAGEGTIEYSSGEALLTRLDGGGEVIATQTITVESGKNYIVSFDLTSNPNNKPIALYDAVAVANLKQVTSIGTYTFLYTPPSTSFGVQLRIRGAAPSGTTFTATVDNISVKQVTLDDPSDPLLIFNHADDQPRIDFDAVTGDRKGLLIEEARTNLDTNSETLEDWDFTQASADSTSQESPDGLTNAVLLKEFASFSSTHLCYFTITVTSGQPQTFSTFAKRNGRDLQLCFGSSDVTGNPYANFNLDSGEVSGTSGSITATIEDYGDGWFRCSATADAASNNSAFQVVLGLINTTNPARLPSYLGDGSSGVYIWGSQIESNAAFPTSYIPTSGSTVTRSADVASIATSAFGFNEDEGTLFTEFVAVGSSGVSFPVITAINDGTNRIGHIGDTANDIRMYVYDGAAVVNTDLEQDVYSGTVFNKLSLGYQENNTSGSSNGNTVVSDTSCTIPTGLSTLEIGSFAGTAFANGHYRKLQYFPRRLSDTELQEITS